MAGESQIPIASERCLQAIRGPPGAVLRRVVRHHGHPSAVLHGVAEGGRDRRVVDRDHLRGSRGDAVHDASRSSPAPRNGATRCAAALIATAFLTALCFSITGTQHQAFAVFIAYAATCCVWTPMLPLTDAYALRGVARYGLNYGPLRLWGSAAFVVGALACGLLVDLIAARHLIWVIAAVAALSAAVSFGLKPLERPKTAATAVHGAKALLRDRGFPRHHPDLGAGPGQPRRLLHLRLDHLAGVGPGRADHRGALGAGRIGRDRGVRAVAAVYAFAGAIGGDRGAQRGGALADLCAGAAACGARRWSSSRMG